MRKYETVFVIDSLLKNEEIEEIVKKHERFISANGGTIDMIDRWGKKRLAYEIKKRQYGYYVLIRFDAPPTIVKPLEREFRLNEAILRYKTLLMTPAALKALSTEPQEQPAETEKDSKAEQKSDHKTSETSSVENNTETQKASEEKADSESETKPDSELPEEEKKSKA